jgi:hypothetical protein
VEIELIKRKSLYLEEKNEYRVPPFYLEEKQVKFPKLGFKEGIDLVENEKQLRDLIFKEKGSRKNQVKRLPDEIEWDG